MSHKDERRTVGYSRVSTDEQKLSPESQRQAIEAYCKLRGFDLVEVLADSGVSGGIPISERPYGSKILSYNPSHIVALRLDRLFRDVPDCLKTLDLWDKEKITLHLVDLGGNCVDCSTAVGRMIVTMMATVAEFERNIIGERTRAAFEVKRKQGKKARWVPFGYDLGADGETLVVNAWEAGLLAHARWMRTGGSTFREIGEFFEAQGAKPKQGGAVWYPGTVKAVLNPRFPRA